VYPGTTVRLKAEPTNAFYRGARRARREFL